MRYLTVRLRPREEVLTEWLPLLAAEAGADGDLGYWVGTTDDGEAVGWWCLNPDPDAGPGTGELGYRLLRPAWGRGYAVEGSIALLDHGFGAADLDRVRAQTMAVNDRSRRVLEALGMHLDRTWVGAWNDPVPGWEQGEVGYAVTRAEWRAGPP